MQQIGRKIYYDKATGNIVLDTGERTGSVVSNTIDQDVASYKALSSRNRDSFDVIELEYGEYVNDFMSCNGYRVNPETKAIEFSYYDPNTPDTPTVYQQPLSEQMAELEARQSATEIAIAQMLGM